MAVARTDRPIEPQLEAQMTARSVYRSEERIGGERVLVWISEERGRFVTGADWQSGKSIYVSGEAVSRAAAEEQLEIYRTAR